MNHNKWIKRFEKEFGTQKQWMSTLATTPYARRSQLDFYRGLKHFIKSLLKEQREEDRKKYLTREGNAEMSRDARARLGLTQVEMAKRLGISTIQLIKVEGGDRGFSKKVLIKLSILKGKKK